MDQAEQLRSATQAIRTLDRQAVDDLVNFVSQYARRRPDMIALWAFGLGFVLGMRFRWW